MEKNETVEIEHRQVVRLRLDGASSIEFDPLSNMWTLYSGDNDYFCFFNPEVPLSEDALSIASKETIDNAVIMIRNHIRSLEE
jgi:hypothetical protein